MAPPLSCISPWTTSAAATLAFASLCIASGRSRRGKTTSAVSPITSFFPNRASHPHLPRRPPLTARMQITGLIDLRRTLPSSAERLPSRPRPRPMLKRQLSRSSSRRSSSLLAHPQREPAPFSGALQELPISKPFAHETAGAGLGWSVTCCGSATWPAL